MLLLFINVSYDRGQIRKSLKLDHLRVLTLLVSVHWCMIII